MSAFFSPIEKEELHNEVVIFNKNHKILYNNFYGVKDYLYEYFKSEHCLFIRYKEFDFYRLFVISDNADILKFSLSQLSDSEYVINIPSKRGIDGWVDIFNSSGFEPFETYSRYFKKVNTRKIPVEGISFAQISDLDDISELLYNNFCKYTDHLPSVEELKQMIGNNQVLVDRDNSGKACGVNIFTITGTTAYGNAWIDMGDNAINLYLAGRNVYVDKGVKYNYFWVRDSNEKVAKMHIKMGAKADGLKDYTFIKHYKL